MIHKAFDLALHTTADVVKAHAGKGDIEVFLKVQVAQLHGRGHGTEGQACTEALIHLAQLHAFADVTFKAQLAASGRYVQQLALERCLELFAGHLHIDQIDQFERRTKGVAPLVVQHFARQGRAVATVALGVVDGQTGAAFPGNSYALMEAFNPKRYALLKKTFAVAGDHFVQGHAIACAIHFDHIALKALAAVLEGNDQRVMALLQQAQAGGHFQRCGEHLG